jgi:hypothetical protein
MIQCVKCGQSFETKATTGRPPSYCSTACRRSAEYELGRINRRLASLEDRLESEKLSLRKGGDAEERRRGERIAALEAMITETEIRFKQLLAAKND